MAGRQKTASSSWAISAGATLGGGKGKVGAGIVALTLFDVQSQIFIPITLYGASVGGGIPLGFSLSTFSPAFFKTSKPIWAEDFHGQATVGGAELTIGVGGSVAAVTFWNVDHDPYWLDIGGVQTGVGGGISVGIYRVDSSIKNAADNDGCIISPGGDPLCGGSSSPSPNSSRDNGMSR